MVKNKPEYRNINITQLAKYRLPLAGKVSIFHRISGLLLLLLLPFSLYLFEQSLTSELSFASFKAFATLPIVKIFILIISWAYLFHFCAGIRFLLTDLHLFLNRATSRSSSAVVLVISTLLTIAVALKLFGVF